MFTEARWENARDVIDVGQALVKKEGPNQPVDIPEIASYSLSVLRFMSTSALVNRQLHDNLHKFINKYTKTGHIFEAFYNLSKRCVQADIDDEWEVANFRNAKLIGDESHQMNESGLRDFIAQARQIQLPPR